MISLVVSVLALAASIAAAAALAVVTDVFSRRRDPGFQQALDVVRAPAFGVEVLVADFFDDLGKLVAHQLVPEDIIIATFGATAVRCWTPLRSYVLGQRAINRGSFDIYYEHLVRRVSANPPDRVLRRMRVLA